MRAGIRPVTGLRSACTAGAGCPDKHYSRPGGRPTNAHVAAVGVGQRISLHGGRTSDCWKPSGIHSARGRKANAVIRSFNRYRRNSRGYSAFSALVVNLWGQAFWPNRADHQKQEVGLGLGRVFIISHSLESVRLLWVLYARLTGPRGNSYSPDRAVDAVIPFVGSTGQFWSGSARSP